MVGYPAARQPSPPPPAQGVAWWVVPEAGCRRTDGTEDPVRQVLAAVHGEVAPAGHPRTARSSRDSKRGGGGAGGGTHTEIQTHTETHITETDIHLHRETQRHT